MCTPRKFKFEMMQYKFFSTASTIIIRAENPSFSKFDSVALDCTKVEILTSGERHKTVKMEAEDGHKQLLLLLEQHANKHGEVQPAKYTNRAPRNPAAPLTDQKPVTKPAGLVYDVPVIAGGMMKPKR